MFARSIIDIRLLDQSIVRSVTSGGHDPNSLRGNIQALTQISGLGSFSTLGPLAAHVFVSIRIPHWSEDVSVWRLSKLSLPDSGILLSGTLDLWRDAVHNWNKSDPDVGQKIKNEFLKIGINILS